MKPQEILARIPVLVDLVAIEKRLIMPTTESSFMGYPDGERVRDSETGTLGTVRIIGGSAIVRWDGFVVIDRLDVAMRHGLERVFAIAASGPGKNPKLITKATEILNSGVANRLVDIKWSSGA